MYKKPISNNDSYKDPKPRVFDVIIEDDGDIKFEVKHAKQTEIIKLRDVLLQILEALQQREGDDGGGHDSGVDYGSDSADGEIFDVFLNHASEDKAPLVDALVQHLKDYGVRVWYDKENITWGDSFRKKMDEGLSKARYGIVIFSPDYIKGGKYWTMAELDALFQKESATGKKILLPVWHHLSKEEILAFSPFIASRNALSTADKTVAEIACEVAKIIHREQ